VLAQVSLLPFFRQASVLLRSAIRVRSELPQQEIPPAKLPFAVQQRASGVAPVLLMFND